MTINVKIGAASDDGITDAQLASKPGIKVRLDVRKTLDGNIIISDHPDIDIIVMPKSSKVMVIPKKLNSGVVYGAQDRLFNYLKDRGVIDPSSIQGETYTLLWRAKYRPLRSCQQLRLQF